jgi:hypothetical protein
VEAKRYEVNLLSTPPPLIHTNTYTTAAKQWDGRELDPLEATEIKQNIGEPQWNLVLSFKVSFRSLEVLNSGAFIDC